MVYMEKIPVEDRRIVIPERVYLRLEDMAADERKKTDNPVIKAMITSRSMAQKILAVAVDQKRGDGRKQG